jgi:jumonji domain-containing protein 2
MANKCQPKWLKPDTDLDTIERQFWKTVAIGPPLYGADTPGSFFSDNIRSWNMNDLRTFLVPVLEAIHINIPGASTPYLYYGMWKAMFAMHTEDMDLLSINYLHKGYPKFWYSIPPAQADKLERYAAGHFVTEKCKQFLRHKGSLLSPTILKGNSITAHRGIQREGEFMITWPKAFHFGFNLGFNCAEAVNFGLRSWIEIGKRAKVTINHPLFSRTHSHSTRFVSAIGMRMSI